MTLQPRETPDGGGLDPMLRPIALEKLHNGVADYDASFELINRYSAGSPYYGKGFRAGQWFETSSDVYWYFLECLPPLHQNGGGFVVSECTLAGIIARFWIGADHDPSRTCRLRCVRKSAHEQQYQGAAPRRF